VATRSKFGAIFEARQGASAGEEEKRGRGRPKGSIGGKRDDANYTQAGAYIRKDVHRRVKAALILEGKEFSELVEELLVEWLKSRP
jgi:hypothetical protein